MKSKQDVGNIGENIATRFLESKGYRILERNYRKKWGELDVIASKAGITHFVEVKTISRESILNVSRDTEYRPEENMHAKKIERLHRAIQTYIHEKGLVGEWQLDLVSVKLILKDKKAECTLIQNVL